MLARGDVLPVIDIYIKQDNWKGALDAATNHNPETLSHVMRLYAKHTMEKGKFGELTEAYATYGMQLIPENFKLYRTLCLEIFVECDAKEVQSLRTALYNFYKLLQGAREESSAVGKQFAKYLTIAHLAHLKNLYEKKNMNALVAKTAVSLLRYADTIRMDKLFHEAGLACKKQNMMTYAFVILNRYLDIYEVIADPESADAGDN